jgi:hypothetical protein
MTSSDKTLAIARVIAFLGVLMTDRLRQLLSRKDVRNAAHARELWRSDGTYCGLTGSLAPVVIRRQTMLMSIMSPIRRTEPSPNRTMAPLG